MTYYEHITNYVKTNLDIKKHKNTISQLGFDFQVSPFFAARSLCFPVRKKEQTIFENFSKKKVWGLTASKLIQGDVSQDTKEKQKTLSQYLDETYH